MFTEKNPLRLTVISGKGGTGKTTVTAQLAYTLSRIRRIVIADCDVDAPNLHILLNPEVVEEKPFSGLKKAKITDRCVSCGLCYKLCRFDAIVENDGRYEVDEKSCEGCSLCYNACPEEAIEMVEGIRGKIFVSNTKIGRMVHAILFPGEENSGKLVMEVKELAKAEADSTGAAAIVVDGAPGIGCPVIASLASTDIALIVAEPTLSGLSDLSRVLELTDHFRIKSAVVINKWDLNKEVTKKIERACIEKGVEIAGKIPYDDSIPKQISRLEFPFEGEAAEAIEGVWEKLREIVQ
ncbi:MAG: (4Fe-4S)-binding protein [Archaeoglobus sp.]|nr:MAG: (4Fe-4S)-binding protein [Archaeoglobus sp.]